VAKSNIGKQGLKNCSFIRRISSNAYGRIELYKILKVNLKGILLAFSLLWYTKGYNKGILYEMNEG